MLRPVLRYSRSRDAYILRLIGGRRGPVVRVDRRHAKPFDGTERRRASAA